MFHGTSYDFYGQVQQLFVCLPENNWFTIPIQGRSVFSPQFRSELSPASTSRIFSPGHGSNIPITRPGKRTVCYGKLPSSMGKSTISMVIFIATLNYQRVDTQKDTHDIPILRSVFRRVNQTPEIRGKPDTIALPQPGPTFDGQIPHVLNAERRKFVALAAKNPRPTPPDIATPSIPDLRDEARPLSVQRIRPIMPKKIKKGCFFGNIYSVQMFIMGFCLNIYTTNTTSMILQYCP